jgi:hypothetical protein
MDAACIDYKETGYFSQTVIDYVDDVPELRSFYSYRPTLKRLCRTLRTQKSYCQPPAFGRGFNRAIL